MNNVSGQEVDVVVAEGDAGVADALAVEVVQFAVIEPYRALKKNFHFKIKCMTTKSVGLPADSWSFIRSSQKGE